MQVDNRTQFKDYLVASLPRVRWFVFFSREHTLSKAKFKSKIIQWLFTLSSMCANIKHFYRCKCFLNALEILYQFSFAMWNCELQCDFFTWNNSFFFTRVTGKQNNTKNKLFMGWVALNNFNATQAKWSRKLGNKAVMFEQTLTS